MVAATVNLTSGLENLSRNLSTHLSKIDGLIGTNFDLMSSNAKKRSEDNTEEGNSKVENSI